MTRLPDLPADGGCRCGAVRFRIAAAPLLTMACHCTGCQRMTGGASSASAMVYADGFEVTSGETVLGGLRGPMLHHHHCDACKSWLFTRIEGEPRIVNVRATMLDDATWFSPFVETWTSEALPWAIIGAPHAYPEFPDMDAYAPLIAEYAARNA